MAEARQLTQKDKLLIFRLIKSQQIMPCLCRDAHRGCVERSACCTGKNLHRRESSGDSATFAACKTMYAVLPGSTSFDFCIETVFHRAAQHMTFNGYPLSAASAEHDAHQISTSCATLQANWCSQRCIMPTTSDVHWFFPGVDRPFSLKN